MTAMCGYQVPWDDDLIGTSLGSLEDFLDFKAQVTDQEIINLLPECLIKAFKYIIRLPDDKPPSYEKLKCYLQLAEESP